MSSLKVHILFLYFSKNLKALWFPKSSNWINTVSPYLEKQKWCPIKEQSNIKHFQSYIHQL